MPQYLTPGVYVEEVPSAIKPIAGVGTSTAGFVGSVADDVVMPLLPGRTGLAADGKPDPAQLHKVAPAGTAVLVDSWDSFKVQFGDVQAGNAVLANAVYGFFNNGGTRAWITRTATSAERTMANALDSFTAIDEIAIVAIPGAVGDLAHNALIDHCENPYAQDRFAILDAPRGTTLTRTAIGAGTRNSSYAALYYPWLDIGVTDGAATVYQPPSGHLAGVYARVDGERGVHKAPANEVIRGALGVDVVVSKAGQSGLNPDGINVIRPFGANVTVWGARTYAGPDKPEWKYIASRRLFNFLRESIDQGTSWAVFEPNAAELWSKVRRNVTAFLTVQWAAGALFGGTPEEAFYVRCDETTNPQAVRDLGQLVTEIGVALVNPAEFVIFRISQWSGPAQ